jgi:hypothetical protein
MEAGLEMRSRVETNRTATEWLITGTSEDFRPAQHIVLQYKSL